MTDEKLLLCLQPFSSCMLLLAYYFATDSKLLHDVSCTTCAERPKRNHTKTLWDRRHSDFLLPLKSTFLSWSIVFLIKIDLAVYLILLTQQIPIDSNHRPNMRYRHQQAINVFTEILVNYDLHMLKTGKRLAQKYFTVHRNSFPNISRFYANSSRCCLVRIARIKPLNFIMEYMFVS